MEEKDRSLTELINYKDHCGTAQATPGLLNIPGRLKSVSQPVDEKNS